MRVPQDIANPLAVAIRDVLWYKSNVLSFYKDCELPKTLLTEVKKQQLAGTSTIRTVHYILDDLDAYGDEGWVIAKRILTKMNYWKDMKSIAPERRQQATESLAAFRAVMKEFQAEQEYLERKEREERERAMQEDREARGRITVALHCIGRNGQYRQRG